MLGEFVEKKMRNMCKNSRKWYLETKTKEKNKSMYSKSELMGSCLIWLLSLKSHIDFFALSF